MLGAICAVTTSVTDLAAIEAAYTGWLGYRVAARGTVDAATAAGWGAPATAGRRFLSLQPESGEAVLLRFVEAAIPEGYRALTSYGWNATEIVVQDVDALAERLVGSPFRVIGPPANLQGFPAIRAMQVLGPAGECVYLTTVGAESGFRLAEARSFVGRVFITVVGGADLPAMLEFYRDRFGNTGMNPVETRISVLSAANNLPIDHQHGLATINLDDGTLIEADRYPAGTGPRPVAAGELPPGMAIVSFQVAKIEGADFFTAPHASPLAPLAGARTATLAGAAGERIELVERPAV